MPLRKSLLALCLAVLITTAGCNALGGGSEPTTTPETTTTTTETTTTTTETTTETTTTTTETTRNATSYPPGIAENGTVMNASALANAHHRILLKEGAVLQVNWTSPHPFYNNRTIDVRLATGGEPIYRDIHIIPTSNRWTFWTNASTRLSRRTENGTTTYRAQEHPGIGSQVRWWATQKMWVRDIKRANNSTLVESKVIDGVRYTTVRYILPVEDENESVQRATITINATGTGVVHSYSHTFPTPKSRHNGTYTHSFEVKQVGDVTVERPDWASKAFNGTNETNETSA